MNAGEIVQVGTPKDIYEYPSSKFVAEFIGNVNMFEGRLIEDEPDHVRIESRELGGTIYVDHGVSSAPDATVWAAMRPEKINISVEKPAQHRQRRARHRQGDRLHGRHVRVSGASSTPARSCASRSRTRIGTPTIVMTWEQRVYLHWHPSSPVVLGE